jgi:hypothetical protein
VFGGTQLACVFLTPDQALFLQRASFPNLVTDLDLLTQSLDSDIWVAKITYLFGYMYWGPICIIVSRLGSHATIIDSRVYSAYSFGLSDG